MNNHNHFIIEIKMIIQRWGNGYKISPITL